MKKGLKAATPMNEKYNPEDQVSLTNLKNTVRGLLQLFFRFCSFISVVIEKGRFIMLGGLLLGCIVGASYYYSNKQYYKGSMLVDFNRLTKKTYGEILLQLNYLLSSPKKLATELQVSEECASKLAYIDAQNMVGIPLIKDTSTRVNQPFKIIIDLHSNDSTEQLQAAIIGYLNNRPLLKKVREVERKINLERLVYIENQLAKLDTLKSEFNHFLASSKISATIYNNAINPAELYSQSNTLIDQREVVQRALEVSADAISLLDGLKVTVMTRPISLVRLLFLSGASFMILGFLFAALIELRKKVIPQKP